MIHFKKIVCILYPDSENKRHLPKIKDDALIDAKIFTTEWNQNTKDQKIIMIRSVSKIWLIFGWSRRAAIYNRLNYDQRTITSIYRDVPHMQPSFVTSRNEITRNTKVHYFDLYWIIEFTFMSWQIVWYSSPSLKMRNQCLNQLLEECSVLQTNGSSLILFANWAKIELNPTTLRTWRFFNQLDSQGVVNDP